MHLDATAFTSFFLCEPLTVCWWPVLAGSASAIAPMPNDDASGIPPTSASPPAPRSPCGGRASASASYADTQSSYQSSYRLCILLSPLRAPRYAFLSWYPWIPGQVSVYVVGRVWHQPNFAFAARHGGRLYCIIYYTSNALQRRHHSDFYYFVPTFLRQEFGSCVQKKARRQCKLLPWKAKFLRASRQSLRASTAIAAPSMPSVISGLHRRSVLLAWIFFVRVVGSQIFIKVTLPSRITSHLQSIFLKLIHFPLITHLSGQSHVIYKPRPIGDNILTRPAGYWRKGFDSPAAAFTRIWRAGDR